MHRVAIALCCCGGAVAVVAGGGGGVSSTLRLVVVKSAAGVVSVDGAVTGACALGAGWFAVAHAATSCATAADDIARNDAGSKSILDVGDSIGTRAAKPRCVGGRSKGAGEPLTLTSATVRRGIPNMSSLRALGDSRCGRSASGSASTSGV